MRGFMDNIVQKYARKNRKNLSIPEKKIWQEILSRKQTGYKFLRQHPISHYIPDFYCRELKLIIEIDGDSHSSQEEYDNQRTIYFESRNLKVIRFTNRDVLYNIKGVEDFLLQEISNLTPSVPDESP
jgi:very-short-patch-repair endonuclease